MPAKLVHVIEGRRWLPIGRAAALLATSTATIKSLMANGSLDWTQSRPNSRKLVVEEQMLLRLREMRDVAEKQRQGRGKAATRTAQERTASMRSTAPSAERGGSGRGFGVFDRTWDPSPEVLPVSGRDPRADGSR